MKSIFFSSLLGTLFLLCWGWFSSHYLGVNYPQEMGGVSQHMVSFSPHFAQNPQHFAVRVASPEQSSFGGAVPLLWSLGAGFLGCMILAGCVYAMRSSRFLQRASIGCVLGLFSAVMSFFPSGAWLELPALSLWAHAISLFLGWSFIGLIIASIVRPPRPRRIFIS